MDIKELYRLVALSGYAAWTAVSSALGDVPDQCGQRGGEAVRYGSPGDCAGALRVGSWQGLSGNHLFLLNFSFFTIIFQKTRIFRVVSFPKGKDEEKFLREKFCFKGCFFSRDNPLMVFFVYEYLFDAIFLSRANSVTHCSTRKWWWASIRRFSAITRWKRPRPASCTANSPNRACLTPVNSTRSNGGVPKPLPSSSPLL